MIEKKKEELITDSAEAAIYEKSMKKDVHRNFVPATLLKKRLWHRCFPVNFAKFLRTPFWQNRSEWQLLQGIDLVSPKKPAKSLKILYFIFQYTS